MALVATIATGGILSGISIASSNRNVQRLAMASTRGDKNLVSDNEFTCTSEGYYIIYGHVGAVDSGTAVNDITIIITYGANTYRAENVKQVSKAAFSVSIVLLLYMTVGQKVFFSWNNNSGAITSPVNTEFNIIKSPTTIGAYGPLNAQSNANANQVVRLNMQPTQGSVTNNEYTVPEDGLYIVGGSGHHIANSGFIALIIDVNGIKYIAQQPLTNTIAPNASNFYTQHITFYKLLNLKSGDKIIFFFQNLTTIMTSFQSGLFGINKIA